MKISLVTAVALAFLTGSASAASLSKTYTYFSIGGDTLDEIETELSKRGPQLNGAGRRHPGATQMEFTTRLNYADAGDGCEIVDASVSVEAKVILPRWRKRAKSDDDVRLFWDTLSSDIKRHEESHVGIAKNFAREIEQALEKLGRRDTCGELAQKAAEVRERLLVKHDKAQASFDRVEGKNFQSRMLRLLRYRRERIEDGRLPG